MLTILSRRRSKFAYMPKTLETTGDRMRRCRKEAGLTQEQLADLVGVSTAAVAQWETGDSKSLKPENLFKAARALNKSAEWLATGDGPETPHWQLEDIVQDLPVSDAQQVLDFIEYRFEKAEGLVASEKVARYTKMIESFKRDLDARKKNDHSGPGRN